MYGILLRRWLKKLATQCPPSPWNKALKTPTYFIGTIMVVNHTIVIGGLFPCGEGGIWGEWAPQDFPWLIPSWQQKPSVLLVLWDLWVGCTSQEFAWPMVRFSSWWLNQRIWKICSSKLGSSSPILRGEHKKSLKFHHLVFGCSPFPIPGGNP